MKAQPKRRFAKPVPKRRPKIVAVIPLAVIAAVGLVWTYALPRTITAQKLATATATTEASLPTTGTVVVPKAAPEVDFNSILAKYPAITASVAMFDNASGKMITAGSADPFVAASTSKVITAICYLQKVEAGKASLDTPMAGYTAGWQLMQMIKQSNNDSWALLNSAIGSSALQTCGRNNGVISYTYGGNTLTAADDALLLAKLYRGEPLTPEHTNLLLSYMQNTNEEGLIPAALPASTQVYHKYGWLGSNLHDTAIIVRGDRMYTLTIFTTAGTYASAAELIHTVTAAAVAAEDAL